MCDKIGVISTNLSKKFPVMLCRHFTKKSGAKRYYTTDIPRVAVVHGGAGQLGREVVSKFASHGWKVVSIDRIANPVASSSFIMGSDLSSDAENIVQHLKQHSR
jgi:hypothetical protein